MVDSTRVPKEILYGAELRGGPFTVMSGTGIKEPWCGRATIASGDIGVIVSCALISTLDIVLLTPHAVNSIGINSGTGVGPLCVTSIDPGGSFVIGSINRQALPDSVPVMWMLFRTGG